MRFKLEAATTAVRDQIMRHEQNSAIFTGAYLNARVRFDIQSAVMERPSVDGLTRAFTHMSITCDPRAPKDVPKHVKDALPRDPKIVKWRKEREALHVEIRRSGFLYEAKKTEKGKRHQKLGQMIRNATKKWEEDIKKAFRRQYFYRIHNEELQRQLNKIETAEYVEPVIHHQLPERTRLQEVLCHFPKDLSPEDIVRRRIRAIDLMVALRSQRETPRPKPCSVPSRESSSDSSRGDSASEAPAPKYSSSESSPDPEPFPLICEKTQCIFFCTGKEKKKTFSRPAKMMDHVESHLRREPGPTVACRHPVCEAAGEVLETVNQFKHHVQVEHGITLRDPWYVR
jgi:hypothetical protein